MKFKNLVGIAGSILITTVCPLLAFAGTEGHGGEVVICPGQQALMYDVYEATAIREGLHLDLGPANLSAAQKVKLALSRYAQRDPVRAARFQVKADAFLSEAKIGDFDLEPLTDANHIALPPHCTISQLIDQREPELPGDKRYFISQRLWNQLNSDQMAVAILHEIIYRLAIDMGQTDSVGSRALNSYIFSGKITSLSDKEYYDLLKATRFVTCGIGASSLAIYLQGYSVGAGGAFCPDFYDDGHLKSADLAVDNVIARAGSVDIPIHGSVTFYNDGHLASAELASDNVMVKVGSIDIPIRGAVTLYDDGSFASLFISGSPAKIEFHGRMLDLTEGVTFDEQGNLTSADLATLTTLVVQNQNVAFGSWIEFYPNGSVKSGRIFATQRLRNTQGRLVTIKVSPGDDELVKFDQNGLVLDRP